MGKRLKCVSFKIPQEPAFMLYRIQSTYNRPKNNSGRLLPCHLNLQDYRQSPETFSSSK